MNYTDTDAIIIALKKNNLVRLKREKFPVLIVDSNKILPILNKFLAKTIYLSKGGKRFQNRGFCVDDAKKYQILILIEPEGEVEEVRFDDLRPIDLFAFGFARSFNSLKNLYKKI